MSRTSFSKPRFLVIAIVLIAIAGAVASVVWRSLADPPVMVRAGGGPQVCLACFESARADAFQLRASRVSRTYRVRRDAEILVSFDEGSVEVDGTRLSTGCHVVSVDADARVVFTDAEGVLVRWPASAEHCDD